MLKLLCAFFTLCSSPAFSAPTSQWYLVGQHFHTADKPTSRGISELLIRAYTGGLDAMIITDHNSVEVCFDSLFINSKMTLICGEEWTTKRSLHLGLFNPPVQDAHDSYKPMHSTMKRDFAKVQDEARKLIESLHRLATETKQITLAVINHPGYSMYRPDDSLGADAAEVLVPGYELPKAARFWWLRELFFGTRLVALGGSDYHGCQNLDCVDRGAYFRTVFNEPVNLVLAEANDKEHLLQAIKQGRVVALAANKYKHLRIDFRSGLAQIGDLIKGVRIGQKLKFKVSIAHAQGYRLAIFGLGKSKEVPMQKIFSEPLLEDGFEYEFEVAKQRLRDAVHVEIWDAKEKFPVAVVNPIYF